MKKALDNLEEKLTILFEEMFGKLITKTLDFIAWLISEEEKRMK